MQQTRLSTLIDLLGDRLMELFSNPWRRLALIALGLLFGVFIGEAIVTTAGQTAALDVPAAALIVTLTEFVSRLVYGRNRRAKSATKKPQQSLWLNVLNAFKIGIVYSLYLQAFILGS